MTRSFFVKGIEYSSRNPLIIAELGTSHGGDLSKAKEMAAAAAESGAACIKYQIVFADEILHPATGEVSLPGGRIPLYDRFKQLEKPQEFYAEIKKYVESLGLLFLCTPFGLKSARILRELHIEAVKIASPELNFTALLQEIAKWNLPVLLSSGVSTLGDIEQAISIIEGGSLPPSSSPPSAVFHLPPSAGTLDKSTAKRCGSKRQRSESPNKGNCYKRCGFALANPAGDAPATPPPDSRGSAPPLCLLHCVTAYPAPETDYNLRVLQSLAAVFGVPSGVSDHSLDPELVPALAVTQGAAAIEKHFCLSRSDPGLDDPIALPPPEFARLAEAVRRAAAAGPEKTLAAFRQERGDSVVEAVLGSGIKTLARSEKENYSRTNRSIHALRDIQAGETITAKDFSILRTEKILRPGLPPSLAENICGRTARQFIPAGEGIRFEDV